MKNYTTNKEISAKVNQHYTSLGYCELSNAAITSAIKKAEKAIKPEVKLDQKYNRKYYEASFLDKAFDYILKNHAFTLQKLTEPSFTITLPDVAAQLRFMYEKQGYIIPPDGTFPNFPNFPNLVLRAERKLKPKRKKRLGEFYYEESFLDEAFDYILKNYTSAFKINPEYVKKQNQVKYTKLLLPCFDLLIGSSKTLGIVDASFDKTAWFNMMNLYNLSRSTNVEEFRKRQMNMALEKEIVTESTGLVSVDLDFAELQLTAMSELLLDFERLIIKEKNKDDDILFNIKDFNEIIKRLYETNYFKPGEDMLVYFDENAINAFLETSENSHVMSKKEKFSIKYEAGNKDFWKKYS